MARPSAAHEGTAPRPASPPPVTYSWTNRVASEAEALSMRIIPVLDVQYGRGRPRPWPATAPIIAPCGRSCTRAPTRSASPAPIATCWACATSTSPTSTPSPAAPPALPLYREIAALGMASGSTPGVRVAEGVAPLIASGVSPVVAGLETVRGPAARPDRRAAPAPIAWCSASTSATACRWSRPPRRGAPRTRARSRRWPSRAGSAA